MTTLPPIDYRLMTAIEKLGDVEVYMTRYGNGTYQLTLKGEGTDRLVEMWAVAVEDEVFPEEVDEV